MENNVFLFIAWNFSFNAFYCNLPALGPIVWIHTSLNLETEIKEEFNEYQVPLQCINKKIWV